MKRMRSPGRSVFPLMVLLLTMLLAGNVQAASKKIWLNEKKVTLYYGAEGHDTFQVKVKKVRGIKKMQFTYKSSNPAVASVSSDGLIKALKKGTASITVSVGKTKAVCKVTVKRPVLKILNGKTVSVAKGGKHRIEVKTVPEGMKVTYSSSDKTIAKVSKKGRIGGKKTGETVITVKSGGRKKTVKVTVVEKKEDEVLSWNPSWRFAGNSKIHSSTVTLYHAANSKGKVVAVNAGHGTSGGSNTYTLCHPDGSAKVTGGSTAAGSQYATAVATGTVFLDGTPEAAANLSVARLVKTMLLEAGYDVLMIRDDSDVQLDNIARSIFANQYADCHIALHYDSTTNDKGAYYMGVPNIASYRNMEPVASNWQGCNRLGECLIRGLKSSGAKVYGTENIPTDLTQTSYSTVPSIDIEVGDRASDHSEGTQSVIAKGIVKGVELFFAE